ncbi:MAG TPA: hypothetical protein VG498_22345 [Terriglobales bacterium]|nr:hypothetical protein [Terriglobales bacterium]
MTDITRREFGKKLTAAVAGLGALQVRGSAASKMIGIQIGAVSFVDEGVGPVLDRLQRDAAVNTLFVAAFSYGRGIAGRQVPGQPLPDHGKQEYDTGYHGGNFAHVHPQYYRDTSLKNIHAPDYGNFDVLGDVIPHARSRGMKSICWYEDVFRPDLEGVERLQEVTLSGRKATTLCFHNPEVQAFWHGLTEDFVRSYELDGIMWGSERQGPFGNAIGAGHGGTIDPAEVTCFCDFCRTEAKARGIEVQRAIEGYTKLAALVRATRAGQRPADGYFVSYWRLLVDYPEILAWEKLWNDGLKATYANIYKLAKDVTAKGEDRIAGATGTMIEGFPHSGARREGIGVGWHIWHNNSFSPFYRAEQHYADFLKYSDFLKVVMYNNCGGPRLAGYIRSVSHSLFADFSPEEVTNFTYRVQNYQEASFAELPQRGLSAEYVTRETKRALAGVGGAVKIWPGIDIDIPTGKDEKKTQTEDVRNAVRAALDAGADGVILSRKYSEMKLANLRAAGEAVKAIG